MAHIANPVLAYGTDEPLPLRRDLRAGSLHMTYENGLLRNIRLGDVLVLQSIYAAVRDHDWNTVPGTLQNVQIAEDEDSFHIDFQMVHRAGNVHFSWDGRIVGEADSTIVFHFEGRAHTTFLRNRIGFCVQHPSSVAGQNCTIEHVDGSKTAGTFPLLIAPHQPYFDIRAIAHPVVPGVTALVSMEGDTFEMEDQRNWTDASFKTYCTPLGLPFPVMIEAGTRIEQRVRLTLTGDIPAQPDAEAGKLQVRVGEIVAPLPAIGLGWSDTPLSAASMERLRALRPSHLRVDLHPGIPGWTEMLKRASAQASAIGTGLEMALFLTDEAETELSAMSEVSPGSVRRWLIFHENEKSTSAHWVSMAREILRAEAPIGSGTDAFFTELNRERPPLDAIDFACYSLNPQVHAFDNDSLVETLPVQGDTVRSAQAFTAGKPIVVSPVTLKMRWNPNATGKAPATPVNELPPQVDTRQMSLFGAGWTLGSIKYLAESGASSLTYYEMVGWLGVMDQDNTLPLRFPAIPGGVYPLYHVLADVQEFAEGEVLHATTTAPNRLSVLALRKGERLRLLLANHTPESVTVTVEGTYRQRLIDLEAAAFALSNPARFRAEHTMSHAEITLPPYAYACLDRESGA